MSNAIVFIRWGDEPKVERDRHNPTILSIASIRAHNPSIPIYVLDTSEQRADYGVYPDLLSFKVLRQNHHYPPIARPEWCEEVFFRLLSRPFDLEAVGSMIRQHWIMYMDSDILWNSDPEALFGVVDWDAHHAASLWNNSGLILYEKCRAKPYLHGWQSLCLGGLADERIRKAQMARHYGHFYADEAPMLCLNQFYRDWQGLARIWNYQIEHKGEEFDPVAKNYHFISWRFEFSKIQYMLAIREFAESLRSVLGSCLDDFDGGEIPVGSVPLCQVGSLFLR